MGSSDKGVPILPAIVPQVEYLKSQSPVPIRVEQFLKGHPNNEYADRFSIYVPCSLDHVRWEVMYNCHHPDFAPDIVFGPDDNNFQPLAATMDCIPTSWALLRDWKVTDPSRLLRLILELRALYLRHHRQQVEAVEDPRVKFEIGTISAIEGLEMRFTPGGDRQGEIEFAVPLDVDVSQIIRRPSAMVGILWNGLSLQVKYIIPKGKSVSTGAPLLKLFSPPALKDVFDVDDFKLPVWEDRMCLMEYVPLIQDTLRVQVQDAINAVDLRKKFVEALFPVFGRPLEYEMGLFRRVSIMVTSGLFCFSVHFQVSPQFPKQQPTLRFQSSQHFDVRGRPIMSKAYNEYPWSPRWDPNHMASRIFEFVSEESAAFKKYCSDMSQHQQAVGSS